MYTVFMMKTFALALMLLTGTELTHAEAKHQPHAPHAHHAPLAGAKKDETN